MPGLTTAPSVPVTPPPELPGTTGASEALANYLRRFSLWTVGNFNNCLMRKSATGAIYLQSQDGSTVWSLTVDNSGALHTTQLTPGSRP